MENLQTKQTQDLWEQYIHSHDIAIRDQLIMQYRNLVKSLALKTIGRYQYFNYMEDIISEGLIALMDAIEKFDLNKKVKFETYGSIKIRGAMIDYIRKQDCFPRRLKKMVKEINEAEDLLVQKLGRIPTDQEMADFLEVSLAKYEKMQSETCVLNMVSFETLIYGQDSEKLKLDSSDDCIVGPEQEVIDKETHKVIQKALAGNIDMLNEKEKLVIALYYKEQLKIKEIAEILGISDPRVSQIHSSALRKLKKYLEDYLNQ